jgi:lipopolysaccharide export system permease protein
MPLLKRTAAPRIRETAPARRLSLDELKQEARVRGRGPLAWVHRLRRRRKRAKISSGEEQLNALWGNNLTFYLPREGDGVSLSGPPIYHAHKPTPARRHYGRDLSVHVAAKDGKRTAGLHRLAHHRDLPWHAQALQAVWAALKWLLTIKPRLQIIERYMWTEVFGFFIVGCMAFTFFMIVTTIFSLGEKIFSKNIPPFTIAKVMLLSAPQFLVLAIPVAVLFSTLMAMGRLNRDNEIIAMTTNGVSLYRIFTPFIAMALAASLMTWGVYEHVVPPYGLETKETLKAFWNAQVVDFIKPGIMISAPNRKYFYVDSIDKIESRMYGIRLFDYFADSLGQRNYPRMFIAKEGHISDQYMVLTDVTFYEINKDTGDTLVEARMPEVRIDIATQLSDFTVRPMPEEMNSTALRTRITKERERMQALQYRDPGILADLNRDLVGYYFKFSIPLACLAFVLVAVPVSLRGPRDERNMGIIMSFMLVMIYYIIFFTCREVGSRGLIIGRELELFGITLAKAGTNLLPPHIAGWLPPSVFLLAAVFLIARARR